MQCYCCSGPTKKAGRFKNRNRMVQRFQCKTCNKTFSEDQPMDGLRIDHSKVIQIVKLLTEGMGIRAIARFADCDPHTVLSVLGTAGQKCYNLHDRLVRNIQTDAIQIDELWARVGLSQRRLTELKLKDDSLGDQYTFLALTAREKFIVSYLTGKRNFGSTEDFIADLASRVPGHIQITSDAWAAYPALVRKYLLGRLDYAVVKKVFTEDHNHSDPNRKYSPGTCAGVRVRVRAGSPRTDRISTSFVERANLSVRHYTKRFARLGLGYSRKLANHQHAVSLFVAAYNWCKVHSTLGCTPAVGIGLADKPWTIERLLNETTSNE